MNLVKSVAVFGLALCAAVSPARAEEPKLDAPVLFIGDSMMKILGKQMSKAFTAKGVVPAVPFSSLGSGLVRPSVFNWNAKADELCDAHHPKTVFVALGANDRQPVERFGGGLAPYGTPEWREEYTRRITELLDRLFADGVRHVVWMLLPPMKTEVNNSHAHLVNEIIQSLVNGEHFKGRLLTYDMAEPLTRKDRKFTVTLIARDGAALAVRENDGVHLTLHGGKRVAEDVLKKYWPGK